MPIAIRLGSFIHKGRSVGFTFWQPQPVTIDQLKLNGCTLFLNREHFGGFIDYPELVLQFSFVEKVEPTVGKFEETVDILVFSESFSDVVHLKARLLSAHIWNKQNSGDRKRSRRKINVPSVRGEPNRMKFSFNENFGTFPNSPPDNGTPPVFPDIIINEWEAHIILEAVKRGALHVERGDIPLNYIPDE